MRALTFQDIIAVFEEFRGGTIEGKAHIVARLVARFLHRLHDKIERCRCAGQTGCKAALVTHIGIVAFRRKFFLQRMEDLRSHANGLANGVGSDRHDHEFLKINRVVGVFATVDDVHHRNRHEVRVGSTDIAVKRQPGSIGGRLCDGKRHTQNGIRSEFALILGAIKLDHRLVDEDLVLGIQVRQGFQNGTVDRLYGLLHTFAQIALTAIPELHGFVCAG